MSNAGRNRNHGFTLVEIIVTLLLLGVMSVIAIPQFIQTTETTNARMAASTVNMIGRANRLFSLDHQGSFNSGAFPTGSGASCGAGVCNTVAPFNNACNLVFCHYIGDQVWGNQPWSYVTCSPAAVSGNCTAGSVSAAQRNSGAHTNWVYNMTTDGVIHPTNAPPPTY